MQRAVHAVLAVLTCLLLAPWSVCGALAQSNQPPASQRHLGHGPTAVSVFRLAKRLVETAEVENSRALDDIKNEALRLPLRNQLALSIRRAHLEPAFGDYVADAIDAWTFWDPHRDTPARLLQRHMQAIEAKAKLAFRAGDIEGAKRLLLQRDCTNVFLMNSCRTADEQLLTWKLDAGDLNGAARRLRETDWKYGYLRLQLAQRVARTFIDAGRADEGFDILASMRSDPNVDRAQIAEAYWRLGAVDDGHRLLREAARAAPADAKSDSTNVRAVWIAGVQMAMGDRDGAVETLAQVQRSGAAQRKPVRAPLAGRLAYVGRDADAFAVLAGSPPDAPVLSNIVVGQARRGDFDAAFATFRQLQALVESAESKVGASSDLCTALNAIARNAARAGNTEAFTQADAIRRVRRPGARVVMVLGGPTRIEQGVSDARSLGHLARAGKAEFAMAYALALPDLANKLEGLEAVAEALSGLRDPFYDPLEFYDR